MSILESIIEGVKEDLAEREKAAPLSQVIEQAKAMGPGQNVREALSATRGKEVALICECKRSSPSKGALAQIPQPGELAAVYEKAGARMISVLTERRRFSGSLDDLDEVRKAVKIPVLRKEFMVSPYQFYEARAHGADCVLLIVAALNDSQLTDFLALTHELGMHALVETHTHAEIERALAANAQIIGVNARNLKTLEVDRSVFPPLAALLPPEVIKVAESGVRTPSDVAEYYAHGADAVLVGEAAVTSEDTHAAVIAMREVTQNIAIPR